MTNELIVMTSSRYGIPDVDPFKVLALLVKDMLFGHEYVDGRDFNVLATYLTSYCGSPYSDDFCSSMDKFLVLATKFLTSLTDVDESAVSAPRNVGIYTKYNDSFYYIPEAFIDLTESSVKNSEYIVIQNGSGELIVMLLKYNLYFMLTNGTCVSEFRRYAKVGEVPNYREYLSELIRHDAGDDLYKLYFKGIDISNVIGLDAYAVADFRIEEDDFISEKYLKRHGIRSMCIVKYRQGGSRNSSDKEMWGRRSLWYVSKIYKDARYFPLTHTCPVADLPEICYTLKFESYTMIGDVVIGLASKGCFVYYKEERMYVAIRGL